MRHKNKHTKKINIEIEKSASIINDVLFIYSRLSSYKKLNPNRSINALFSKLVALILKHNIEKNKHIIKDVISDARIRKIITHMRSIASQGEYSLEEHYAQKMADRHKSLRDFPYYKNYKKLTDIEASYIGKRNTLFIGSGPLPLSPFMYINKGIQVSVLDKNSRALQLSMKFFKSQKFKSLAIRKEGLSLADQVPHIKGSIQKFESFEKYECIFIGALVGNNPSEKNAILEKVIQHAKPRTRIIARTATGLAELLYSSVTVPKNARIQSIIHVPVHKDIINPIIVIDIA